MEEKVRRKESTGISAKYFAHEKNVTELPVFFRGKISSKPIFKFSEQ